MNELIENESLNLSKTDGNEKLPSSGGILTFAYYLSFLLDFWLSSRGNCCFMSKRLLQLYKDNPSKYIAMSFNHVNSRSVCGIIGICISILTLFIVFLIVIANS
jgi:hypothetical protein